MQHRPAHILQRWQPAVQGNGLDIFQTCMHSTRGPRPQETTRVLGLLAAPSCPVRDLALQPPALNKALNHIRKHMQVGAGAGR